MRDLKEIVSKHPVLAILRAVPLEDTLDYVSAAIEGGVSFFEVALNSPDALEQISLLRRQFGDSILLGAGTAVTKAKCEAAIHAGAEFLLTPGTPTEVFDYCRAHDVALLPGVLTAAEVATALSYGYSTMKLFPASCMPASYVTDLQGPFDGTQYVAIGGVTADNIRTFFQNGFLGVGLARSLMPREALANKDWSACAEYVADLVRKTQ